MKFSLVFVASQQEMCVQVKSFICLQKKNKFNFKRAKETELARIVHWFALNLLINKYLSQIAIFPRRVLCLPGAHRASSSQSLADS